MKVKAISPLVSVIIPTTTAWILKEAVDSTLAQEFRDFELIVVDDGSTDATAEVLAATQTGSGSCDRRTAGSVRPATPGLPLPGG
jgi:cellulose synthase/poly-beta-1,6-N-acetylglucosamine synthase-like glycosyltransferase